MIKLSFNLQPRLLSLPWLKRGAVRCFSHEADGLNLPVQYIPKKHRDVKQAGCSSSGDNSPKNGIHPTSSSSNGFRGHKTLDTIKPPRGSRIDHEQSNVSFVNAHVLNDDCKDVKVAAETKSLRNFQEVVEYMDVPGEVVHELQISKRDGQGQGCNLNQENSYYDGAMDIEFPEELEDDVVETELYNGIGEGKQEISKPCRTKQGAEKMAIELLTKRAFTGVELRKKLTAKDFPVNVVEAVVSDFQNRGLINDLLYAEMFSHSRWKASSWGPRRIKQALVKKGVSEGDVEKAVKLVFEDGEECDLRSSTRLSSTSLQQLYVQFSKQWLRSQNVPHETRKARIIRWLQYRGFDWAIVSIILKKLESEYPP